MNKSETKIDWQWYALDALSASQVYAVLAAREAVFVVEQACAYQDLDGLDAEALHLVGWSAPAVAAYLRVLNPGTRFEERSIGRVLTTANFRGRSLGRVMMELALDHLDRMYPGQPLRISAQAHLEPFYASLRFARVSALYMEDHIPHIEMLRQASL